MNSVAGATSGLIDGSGGADTLLLSSADLRDTTIQNIEATILTNSATHTVDAAQVINLGTLSLSGTAASLNRASIALSNGNGQTADFSGLELQDGEELTV